MLKFMRSLTGLILAGIIIAASACSSLRRGKTPSPIPYFDLKPETVILYADIHYPGIPRPTKTPNDRYCTFMPLLRVWGDGFAFLDEYTGNEQESVLSGQLDPATLRMLYDILNSDSFFTAWNTPEVNPSGSQLKLGAQLKDKPVTEYTSGDLQPPVYLRLIETIKPALKPLAEQGAVDARVEAILKEYENCNQYLYTR